MSNAVSVLDGAVSDGNTRVTELGLQGMLTLRGDLTNAALADALRATAGLGIPAMRQMEIGADATVAWMSPDEILLMCGYSQASALADAVAEALAGHHALVSNVSDARAIFEVSGPHAREVIAKLAPVDMSALATAEIRRTRLAQVAAAVWMQDEDRARVICFRSVAQYVFDLLCTAARDGTTVDHFQAG